MQLKDFRLYRFSRIEDQERLIAAVRYVAESTTDMLKEITGESLPIGPLTVFSHYPDEFENLKSILVSMGQVTHQNNGPFVRLDQPIKVGDQKIVNLRVRMPDPYRMQVGCNDFIVNDYVKYKGGVLHTFSQNVRLFDRPDFEMIEFYHPDYDVLAYVLGERK